MVQLRIRGPIYHNSGFFSFEPICFLDRFRLLPDGRDQRHQGRPQRGCDTAQRWRIAWKARSGSVSATSFSKPASRLGAATDADITVAPSPASTHRQGKNRGARTSTVPNNDASRRAQTSLKRPLRPAMRAHPPLAAIFPPAGPEPGRAAAPPGSAYYPPASAQLLRPCPAAALLPPLPISCVQIDPSPTNNSTTTRHFISFPRPTIAVCPIPTPGLRRSQLSNPGGSGRLGADIRLSRAFYVVFLAYAH